MDSVSPINHFGTPAKGDYTVTALRVQGSIDEYVFNVTRTSPGRVRGITIQQLVVPESPGYPDRDSAIDAGIQYVESLFNPHKFDASNLMTYAEETLRSICIARDMNWDTMTNQEREALIDTLLYEDKNPPKADIESDPIDVEKENAGDM